VRVRARESVRTYVGILTGFSSPRYLRRTRRAGLAAGRSPDGLRIIPS
jgi:hypothetical protein